MLAVDWIAVCTDSAVWASQTVFDQRFQERKVGDLVDLQKRLQLWETPAERQSEETTSFRRLALGLAESLSHSTAFRCSLVGTNKRLSES